MRFSHENKIPLNFLVNSGDLWEVGEDLHITLSQKNYQNEKIVIPKGFKTDLASVPRVFNSIINTYGDFMIGSLIHDWLYKTDFKRDELGDYKARLLADREMLIWSKKYNKNKFENQTMFWGVRSFGAKIYKRTPNESK